MNHLKQMKIMSQDKDLLMLMLRYNTLTICWYITNIGKNLVMFLFKALCMLKELA